MKLGTMTIIKDVMGMAFIVWVLATTVSDWWTILGFLVLTGNYSSK